MMTDKIDTTKLDQASALLKQIMEIAQNYDKLFKDLTPQEKYLAGGIVFRIRNVWNDFSLVGIMVDRELAGIYLDDLISFYRDPATFLGIKRVQPIQVPPTIISNKDDGNKGGNGFLPN